jgi:hypothetical protein
MGYLARERRARPWCMVGWVKSRRRKTNLLVRYELERLIKYTSG